MGNTQGQQEEETPSSAPPPPAPQAIIWTRRNIILFVIVVVQGAIILAYMIFVALLFFSPELRQRVIPPDSGAMLAPLLGIWGYFFERYGCYSPLPPAPVPIPGQGGDEHWAHRRVPLHPHTPTGDGG